MTKFINIFISVWIGIKMAGIEMANHKLRSFLSMLGVMLGVASLVAMLTLVGGIDVFLKERMGRWMGSIWIWKMREPPQEEKLSWSRSPGLRLSDGEYLAETSDKVEHSFDYIQRGGYVHVFGEDERVRVRGVSEITLAEDTRQIGLHQGRWLSKEDYAQGKRMCLISWGVEEDVVRRLQSVGREASEILGMTLTFKNVQFIIVGTLRPKDPDYKPWHWRNAVIVPLKAMQKYVTGMDPDPGFIQTVVADPEKLHEQALSVARTLQGRHRGVEDFEYRTANWAEQVSQMFTNVSILMSILAIVSLIVGGLGIMNVMLSSISERIHEIGVRKALGAQNVQLFVQFIAETTTLCCLGGLIGIVLGTVPLFFDEAIKKSTDGAIVPTLLSLHIMYVFTVIVGVGVVFGLYPAIKASRMNPVDALRYE